MAAASPKHKKEKKYKKRERESGVRGRERKKEFGGT
jgi:hypothetical protein